MKKSHYGLMLLIVAIALFSTACSDSGSVDASSSATKHSSGQSQ